MLWAFIMESVSSDDQLNSWKTKFFTFCDETNTSTLQSGPSWKEVGILLHDILVFRFLLYDSG